MIAHAPGRRRWRPILWAIVFAVAIVGAIVYVLIPTLQGQAADRLNTVVVVGAAILLYLRAVVDEVTS